MSCYYCPASMCPLIAPNGSPWTGTYNGICHGNDVACEFWSYTCNTGGMQLLVEEAAANGGRSAVMQLGPNKPRREGFGEPKSFDCPRAHECRWQERAELEGRKLCPPRDALARGIDPRVCVY